MHMHMHIHIHIHKNHIRNIRLLRSSELHLRLVRLNRAAITSATESSIGVRTTYQTLTLVPSGVIKHDVLENGPLKKMMFLVKPPFIGDFPLLCLVTRGYIDMSGILKVWYKTLAEDIGKRHRYAKDVVIDLYTKIIPRLCGIRHWYISMSNFTW